MAFGGDRSGDRRRPWRGLPALPQPPICPSCDRRRRRRPWCKGPGADARPAAGPGPRASRRSGPAASAVAISASRSAIAVRLRLAGRGSAHEGGEIGRRLPEGRQMTVERWCTAGAERVRRRRRFSAILWISTTVSPGLCSTISARMPPWSPERRSRSQPSTISRKVRSA